MSYVTEKFVEAHPGRRIFWFNWNRPDVPSTFAWSDITGKPLTFPPSPHTHPWDEITDKPTTFPTDPPEVSIFDLIGWRFNALKTADDLPLLCGDGAALYESGSVIDNPPCPTRYVNTVAEILQLESQTWDRAVAMNDTEIGDGQRSEWRMLTAPWVSNQVGFNLRPMNDGGGYAERLANLR